MFRQINSDWVPVWKNLKVGNKVHNPLGNEGLNYYTIDKLSARVYLECLPERIRSFARVMFVSMQGPFTVHAHQDTGCKTAINYYLKSGNAITRFYDNSNGKKIKNYLGYNVNQAYDRNSLNFAGSFNAKDLDTYIIDTQKVHDVHQPLNSKREFIQWGLDLNYEDVICHFE